MLRLITSHESRADAQGMIYADGEIHSIDEWVRTDALLVEEVRGEPFRRYYLITATDVFSEDDRDELDRLEAELGRKLADCVVDREKVDQPAEGFPGSSFFYLVTLYAE